MTTWDLGINGFSWHADEDVLRREADLALAIGYRYAYGDMGMWGEEVLEKAHRVFEPLGLKIWSTHGVTGIRGWEYDVDGAAERMGEQIRRAGAMGIGHVTYHTIMMDMSKEDPAVAARRKADFAPRFHRLFGKLVPIAEAAGVSLNIENVEDRHSNWYPKSRDLVALIEPVGSDAMGLCIDSGHAHMSDLPVADVIRAFGTKLRETHFHDNLGKADRHMTVGVGSIDWVDVINALDEIDYRSPVVFEWAGTYWSEIPFIEIARAMYFNWRQFEALAEAVKAG